MFTRISQAIDRSRAILGFITRSLFLLSLFSTLAVTLDAQKAQDAAALKVGKPIELELLGDQSHSYSIAVTAGQYLHVVVDQRGIDVVVTVFGPDGKKLAEVDSTNGTTGPESVSVVTEMAGNYRLELHSLTPKAAAGRYEVKIIEQGPATKQDRARVAAQKAYADATELKKQDTEDALKKATERYEEAIRLWREVKDQRQEANALNDLGGAYNALGEKPKALETLALALQLRRAVGDRPGQAVTLNDIGVVYWSQSANQKAIEYYNEALKIRREINDRAGEGETLGNLGLSYVGLSEYQKALEYLTQSLPLRRDAGDLYGQADTLNSIGMVYDALGDKQKEIEYFTEALLLVRGIGDRRSEAFVLSNIGYVYQTMSELQKGLEYGNQALTLFRAVGERGGEANTLSNIGVIFDTQGEYQHALDYYNLALPALRAVGDREGEAKTLINMSGIFQVLGEKRKALEYMNQSLPILREIGDKQTEGLALSNIGFLHNDFGEKQAALDYYNQSLKMRIALSDRAGQATTLNNLGFFYQELGDKQKALDYYNQSLALSRAVQRGEQEADTINNMGVTYVSLGDNAKALEYYQQALTRFRAMGKRTGEANTLRNIAIIERDRGNLVEARKQIESALVIIESLRTKIASRELRASYFATMHEYYEFYIDILMRLHKQQPSAGHDGAALQASERARARSLLETLAEANADIRQGVDTKLLERERTLQQRLNAKAEEQTKLLGRPHTEEKGHVLALEIETLTTEFQQVEAEIRQTSPRYAALTQPQPLNLKEIQEQLLDQDTLLLEYSLGKERSYLWAVTPTSIASYQLPNRDEVETLARRVYELLIARQPKPGLTEEQQLARAAEIDALYQTQAAILSRMLLGPISAQLGAKRLLVVSDGALQYIPFGSLPAPVSPDPRLPLIAEHEIISLPSASTLAVLRQEVKGRKPAAKTVVVLADPVFGGNDKRITEIRSGSSPGNSSPAPAGAEARELPLGLERSAEESGMRGRSLPRLPGTRAEAKQILSLVATGESKEALDFAASRQTATSAELSQYRYVHFATHGFLNSLHPELSGIVLSMFDETGTPQDGFLRAHEIFNLKLPAEVVVLSACQTGLGKDVKGEGLVGLTRGFMYAGAPRVVVSLWSVSDQATAELMARFYHGMLKDKLRPAAALRAAQVSLMKEPGWESPFYWAAFTLQGEWR